MPATNREMKSAAELKADEVRKQKAFAEPDSSLILDSDSKGLQSYRTALPSRDRVSAAIALVRARQAARDRSSQSTAQQLQVSPRTTKVSPRSPKTFAFTNVSAHFDTRNPEKSSPVRSPLSPTQGRSPARSAEANRISPSKLRMPLSPKAPDPSPTGNETHSMSQSHATVTSSPTAKPSPPASSSLFSNFFPTRVGSNGPLAVPALMATTDENDNQENSPEDDQPNTETPVSHRADFLKNHVTPARTSLQPHIAVEETVSTSNDSDDCSVDPRTLNDVARFIDAVHNKQKAKLPTIVQQQTKSIQRTQQKARLRPSSSESTEDENSPVSPETLAGIGQYIDAIAKPKEKAIKLSQTSSSDGDDIIPIETKVGIGAFIDALHHKSDHANEAKQTLYVSSSDDSSVNQNMFSDIDTYYKRRSMDHNAGDEDEALRLLDEALGDDVDKRETDFHRDRNTVSDSVNPAALEISPNPSELAGEDFLALEANPISLAGDTIEAWKSATEANTQVTSLDKLDTGISKRDPEIACSGIAASGTTSRKDNLATKDQLQIVENNGIDEGNSDDALDDAINAALKGEYGSTFSDDTTEPDLDKLALTSENSATFAVLEDCDESTTDHETKLPTPIPSLLDKMPADCNLVDDDADVETNQVPRANDDGHLFSKMASSEGASDVEIPALKSSSNRLLIGNGERERLRVVDPNELVTVFLSGGSSSTTLRNNVDTRKNGGRPTDGDSSVDYVSSINSPTIDETIRASRSNDHPSLVVNTSNSAIYDPIYENRSVENMHTESSNKGWEAEFNVDSGKFEGSNEGALDDDAGELVNAFLKGSPNATTRESPNDVNGAISSHLVTMGQVSEPDIDVILQEFIAKIGEHNSAIFVDLVRDASREDIKKLKIFMTTVMPYLSGKSAPLVAEAQVRSVAFRIGLAPEAVEKVIDRLFGKDAQGLTESRSADSLDLDKILNDEKFERIEEVDEAENIAAFLSRMNALEAGGHFGEAEANHVAADEAVEVDLDVGFVNKTLETVASEEFAWWDGAIEKGHDVHALSVDSRQVQTRVDEPLTPTSPRYGSIETRRSQSGSPRKSGIPRAKPMKSPVDPEQLRALQNQKAQATSQQLLDTARSFVLNSLSADDVQPSLSLTKVPSLINDLETMFEEREKWIIRSNNAKHARWKNPWETRWTNGSDRPSINSTAIATFEASKAPHLGGVAAAMKLSIWSTRPERHGRRIPVKQQWRLAYKERTRNHAGYSNIDVYSLYDATIVVAENHPYDDEPWEFRDVKQRFLHEKSISMSRNWFGTVLRKRGNDRYREPVAKPKSMEMPMENLPGEGEWLEDWYTTWQQRHNETKKRYQKGMDSGSESDSDESDGSETCNTYTVYTEGTRGDDDTGTYSRSVYTGVSGSVYTGVSGSVHTSRRSQYSRYTCGSQRYGDDDDSWEDPPECGTFQNVKQRIGERLSLVHYGHLSSLRQSKWRKRYFPRGSFPYK